jgi:hypothetical protein
MTSYRLTPGQRKQSAEVQSVVRRYLHRRTVRTAAKVIDLAARRAVLARESSELKTAKQQIEN